MKYYQVCLQVEGRPCLVVGGGRVASRKARGLLESGARVTVVSPELSEELRALADSGAISWQARGYKAGEAAGYFLVMAATDDQAVQKMVYADAEQANTLVNVADVPERCNFILPALVRRGGLTIAVSTSGNSPALAKKMRRQLENQFGWEYETLCAVMGVLRPVVLARGNSQQENEDVFNRLLGQGLLERIADRDWPGVMAGIDEALGFSLPADTAAILERIVTGAG